MIRLKTEIHKDVLQKVILNPFGVEPGVSYKMMTSITAYRHNFFIEDLNLFNCKCSFWIGSAHNSRKSSDHVDFVIEYNPNKCVGSVLLDYVIDHIFRDNRHVEVKSLDVAIDIRSHLISQSTRKVLSQRKKEGKKLGRPFGAKVKSKLENNSTEILQMLDAGISKSEIARQLGINRASIYAFARRRGISFSRGDK